MTFEQLLWVAIPAISFILYGILFYIRRRDLGEVERWFSAFLLSATVWSLGSMLLHIAPGNIPPVWWNRLLFQGNVGIPLTVFGFSVNYLSLRNQRPWINILVFFYGIFTLLNLSGQVVVDATVINGLVDNDYGWGLGIVAIIWTAGIYPSIFLLARELRRSRDRIFRNRLKYLLVVTIVLLAGSLLNLVNTLSAYPVDLLMAVMAAVLIFLSISRYQLIELERSVRRLAGLVAIVAIYVAILAISFYLISRVGRQYLTSVSIVAALVTVALLLLYQPTRESMIAFVDRILVPTPYNFQHLVYRISRVGNRLSMPAELGNAVLEEICQTMQITTGAILIHENIKGLYVPMAIWNLTDEAWDTEFKEDSPLVKTLRAEEEAIQIARLRELPKMRALWIEEWDRLERLRPALLQPIKMEQGLLGFFVLGEKEGGEPFVQREINEILPTLANQLSIAIDNSRLYAQAQARANALAAAIEELKELDRMKDELIQNVSHELRTPIAIIQGYAELLSLQYASVNAGNTEDIATTIMQQSTRLNKLVNDVMTMSQVDNDRRPFVAIDLYDLALHCIRRLSVAFTPAIEIILQPPAHPLPPVSGIPDRIEQVLENLVNNAVKFSPDGRGIEVRIERRKDEACVSVKDWGIGIGETEQRLIWQRFYQADASLSRKYRGAGLGLAIVQKIVAMHGGQVGVESTPGEGSTFWFTLPLVQEAMLQEHSL